MIKYCINETESMFEVKVKGHARYDEIGKDIVCASVSSYCYLLLELLTSFRTPPKSDFNNFKFESGNVELRFLKTKNTSKIVEAFSCCMSGLSDHYIYRNYIERVGSID